MANMYPIKEALSEIPYSELVVYELLEKLSDSFTVFHSVQWVKKGSKWKSTWKENDFLILHPKLGGLVIEIKGGDIKYQDGVFLQTNTQTHEVSVLDPQKKKDPLSQAIDGIYHYREVLDSIKKKLSDRFPIEAAVWFPSCNVKDSISSFPLKYREIEGAVLDYNSVNRGVESVRAVFDFYASHGKVDITDEEYVEIIDSIASDFELVTVPGVKNDILERAFIQMTKEQTSLLDYISDQDNATIQGIAGTGKTVIAKEAARRYGATGRKVLFLCFNRFLFSKLSHSSPYANVSYFNIHTFISKYRENVDLLTSQKRAAELLKIDWDELDYDDVIIDEGQDFLNDEILYFKDFVEYKGGHFLVFYDKNQLLTTDEVPTWVKDSECKLKLTKNCRNTHEIAITSYNAIDLDFDSNVLSVNGDPTSLCFVGNTIKPSLANLIKMLTGESYGYDLSDIVVLTLCAEHSSVLKDTTKLSGINFTPTESKGSVLLTTASKFKGLESKVVIVTDIDEACFADESKKRLFYVACSRATQHLFLMIDGDKEKITNIANTIDPQSKFAAKGQIAMKTHTQLFNIE